MYSSASKCRIAIKSRLYYRVKLYSSRTKEKIYIYDGGVRSQCTASTSHQVNYRDVPCCEVPPIFFVCFHYYFHTVGLLWALLQITVSGKCNKSHVLILSVWFHQASYTPRKKNYEVLLIVSATDNSTDKLKFVWLAETLLLGYISSKWFAWNQQSCLDKNCNIWLLCEWNGK